MRTFFALSSLLALSLTACGGAGDEGPIKLGYIGPLTGDAASYGIDTLNGTKMKVDEINAAGGINGRQIQLIAEDGKCAGADAATAVQKLVNIDKVIAIVGGQCSGETLAAAPVAEAAKVILLSPLSSSPDVTNAGAYVYRDYPSDALKTKAMAAYFQEKGLTKVAVITENTDFAQGFRASLKKDFGDFAFDEVVEPGTKDFRSLMTRLKNVDFDVFLANGQSPATIAPMVVQLREQGMKQLAITHDAGQSADTLSIGGKSVEGLEAINVPALGKDTAFGSKFIAQYGEPQGAAAFGAHAYDAVGVLAEAIGAVGANGEAIKGYLDQLEEYPGVVGTFHFDENGDVVGMSYALIVVQNGAWVQTRPIAIPE
ncbi:ABC transporter substrate-binding protein [Candidatus Peribacteria bacterium]|nr:ABC transporter substrate-binding protein [Candidatus Peribacteria bacterium]